MFLDYIKKCPDVVHTISISLILIVFRRVVCVFDANLETERCRLAEVLYADDFVKEFCLDIRFISEN